MAKVNFDSAPVQQFIKIYLNYLHSLPEYEEMQLLVRIRNTHLNTLPSEMRQRIINVLTDVNNPPNANFVRNLNSMAIYNLGCRGDSVTLELPPHLIDMFNDTFLLQPQVKGSRSAEKDLAESQNRIKEKANQLKAIQQQSLFNENKKISNSNISVSSAGELIPKNWTKDDLRRSFLMSEIIRLPRCKRKKIR